MRKLRVRPLVTSIATIVILVIATSSVRRNASASPSDSDEDEAADTPPTVARERRAPTKPVRFDAHWLEPFFEKGLLRRALDSFRQDQWAAAETQFLKGAARVPASSGERQAARYMAALARENQSKWGPAAELFGELHRTYPRLAAYHAYHAARCHVRGGEPQAALEWAERVPAGSVPEAESQLIAIDALRTLGRWRDVADRAAAYTTRFKNGPRLAEALFRQAEALEKLPGSGRDEIAALYRRIWAEAPLESWADRATERLEALAAAASGDGAAKLRARTAGEWLTRGMVFFDRNRNSESETAFTTVLASPGLTPEIECKARYHRAQSIWKQRQRTRAAPLFDEAEATCARAGNRDLRAKSLYQGARCWAAAGDRAAATARFGKVETDHADHNYADDARLRAAELARDAGENDVAAKLLAELPTKYPAADILGEALWRLALAAWQAGQDDEALKWLDENLSRIPREEIWYAEGRALYWKGRVLERKSDPTGARTHYEKAIREYPLSVYALLAMSRLGDSSPKARAALVRALRDRAARPPAWRFSPRPLFGDPGFLRAVELARLGQGSDARRELTRLGLDTSGSKQTAARRKADDKDGDDEDLYWIAAVLLDRGRLWNASHSLPRYTVTRYRLEYPRGLGTAKWRLSYPRAFPELVAKNARANRIPEALQLAIMREESAFSPRIESFANAVGLTQMLVKTARRFSNGTPVTREALMDPAKNLECGSRFLAFLWNRFGKAAPLTIAGYNAGEGAVDRWLAERGSLAMDEFMETIPYDETRNYTKRVLASYFTYTWLYDEKNPVPTIPLAARGK